VVLIELLKNWDTSLFLLLNGWHNPFLDFLMYWISEKWVWIPFYLILLLILIKEYKIRILIILLFIAVLITLSDQISSSLFKECFKRLRPCYNPSLEGMVHLVKGHCGGMYGFVSSHAANTSALAFFLRLILKPNYGYLRWILIIWVAVVSYSRIYLGVHFPADVMGGIMLGVILAFLMYLFFINLRLKNTQRK